MGIYKIFRPLIFKLDAESAHNLAINFLKFMPNSATLFALNRDYKNLHTKLWELDFSNPIGLAAGFDKNAEAIKALSRYGFGFLEVGTVTPKFQSGNKTPRLFRLSEDKAIINRFGFNSLGSEVFFKNAKSALSTTSITLGINIGKNKNSEDAVLDYLSLLQKFYEIASYITINISSPNTKNLRDLQKEEQLDLLLSKIMSKKDELKNLYKKNTPVLLKVAPDLNIEEQQTISDLVIKHQVDGMIVSNTTTSRLQSLKSGFSTESGGLSGKPLFKKSNEILKNFYSFTEGKIPLIGVGGVSSAADAYEKIKCGASLVQIYSSLIYQGMGLVEKIKKDLSDMLKKDGFQNISQVIGTNNLS